MQTAPASKPPDMQCSKNAKGRHRIMVELKHLEQEAKFLEDELDELEKITGVSNVCPDLVQIIESRPDPLLPITVGPGFPSWERWFQGPFDSHGSACGIL